MKTVDRRRFLGALAVAPLAAKSLAAAAIPIIDAHIHLFDRNDSEGGFWPPKNDPAYEGWDSFLPPRYQDVVHTYGIVGAIAVETNAVLEYNQWVLDQAAKEPIMLGYIGFLDPGTPEFGKNLERFHKNQLFLGIRYSNRNKRPNGDIADAVNDTDFITNLRLLADAGLSFDFGAPVPDPSVMLRLTDRVPSLRVVIPHLPNAKMPQEAATLNTYMGQLREVGKRPHVFWKLTEVVKQVDGKAAVDLALYRDKLDQLWDAFGENRVLFGTDWPQMKHVGSLSDVMSVANAYIASKGSTASERVYWRNSVAAYRWKRRDATQPKV